MMDLLKAILQLISDYFKKSTVETKKEVAISDAKEEVVVQTIRANTNAFAIQQQEKAQQAVEALQASRVKRQQKQEPTQMDDDDQFGSEW